MILYIADSKKIEKFKLPETIDESFLFNYTPSTGESEHFISIYAKDSKWYLKNTENVSIAKGPVDLSDSFLEDNHQYRLKISASKTSPIMYCKPRNPQNSKLFQVNTTQVTIGHKEDNVIRYVNRLTVEHHASIVKQNNNWYLTASDDLECETYLNNARIKQSILKRGDIIFINGLKIVWMEEFIKIDDMNNSITIGKQLEPIGAAIEQNNFLPKESLNEEEENIQLYRKDEYFYHRPRIKKILEDKKIKIDAPPSKERKEDIPFWLSFGSRLTMLTFSFVMVYNGVTNYNNTKQIASLVIPFITGGAMLLGSLLFPALLQRFHKKNMLKKEKLRQEKYSKYLEEKVIEINEAAKLEQETLRENNPDVRECAEIAIRNRSKLWMREINDSDFLTVRLGKGSRRSTYTVSAPEKKFELYDDNLFTKVINLVEKSSFITDVPITVSFADNSVSSIICDTEFNRDYINSILLQLMVHHSSADLKIVYLTTKENEEYFRYMKNAPHCWNDEKTVRYFASNIEDMKEIAMDLEPKYNEREENDNKASRTDPNQEKEKLYYGEKPYYIIITDNFREIKTIEFFNKLMTSKQNYGFSTLFLSSSIQELPNTCDSYIYVLNGKACILKKEVNSQTQVDFIPEFQKLLDMEQIIYYLANIPIEINNGLSILPSSISFLEMYNIGRLEQLNILNKWRTNDPINTLQAPIGVYANGDLFKLDLHEKKHGPHGLIAGSTGSGKSEFIITYILSMAVNYHPDYVQFVLIDYKGGGLAGAFENRETGEKIPHLAGTITNLDSSEMNRTLVSIESELKRRQQRFNEVRDQLGESTVDIYKYQRLYREGVVLEPIPHLFIISDEFAELKQQQPDFMDQLISTARIGRSLGVHLILATQKPSGVVNDQIWSNSKFKVCLRVQSRSDSMEMLKREEAANIKETGRFYLQVGYNELFEEGQSAWCGAKYLPSDQVKKKQDNSLEFIDNIGNTVKKINDVIKTEVEEDHGEQITNIVKYIMRVAQKEEITPKNLWLPSLKDEIFISEVKSEYNFIPKPYQLKALIGIYDSPTTQTQGPATIDFTNNGNLLVYGETGSGKENLINTIITSLSITHTSEEVNFYIVDYGAESTKRFHSLPHVGDIVYSDELEKLNNLIIYIVEEIDRRKKKFANYMGEYNSFIRDSNEKTPQIIVIINALDVLMENQYKAYEKLMPLFRDAIKYGIFFVTTVTTVNTARFRLSQLFGNKICLQLQDKYEYRNLLDAPRNVFPARKFGRGLIQMNEEVMEFQTAILCKPELLTKTIQEYGIKASQVYKYHAPRIKVLPNQIPIHSLLNEPLTTLTQIPIGIKKRSLDILYHNFMSVPVLPIISNFLDEEFSFIYGLVSQMKTIPNTKVRIVDFLNIYEKTEEDVPVYKSDFNTVIQQIEIELDKDSTTERTTVFIFAGISLMKDKIDPEYQKVIPRIFQKIKKCKNNIFITADNYISYRSIEAEPWYSTSIDKTTGIWLGDGANNQFSIKAMDDVVNARVLTFKDMAYLINKGKTTLFKHIIDEERKENE